MVKMGSEAPKAVTPPDFTDITGGTGKAPGETGGPPLGWTPAEGEAFVPLGADVEKSLEAAVVKPGVAFVKTEEKDIMPPPPPDPEEELGAASAIPDLDGDGISGPSDVMMLQDVAFISDLGIDVSDVVEDPASLMEDVDAAGITDVNKAVEIAALAGPDAVDVIKETGDIDAAVEVAKETFVDVAVVVNDVVADVEKFDEQELPKDEVEVKTLTEDQADPAKISELIKTGELDIDVKPLVEIAATAVSYTHLTLPTNREV